MTREAKGDLYAVLGVDREASPSDINRAYRRAARATHPDSTPGDPSASDRFKAVSDAYDTLRDPGRRAEYDRTHPAAKPAASRPVPPGGIYGPGRSIRLGGTARLGAPPVHLGFRPWFQVEPVTLVVSEPTRPAASLVRTEPDLVGLAALLSRWLRMSW